LNVYDWAALKYGPPLLEDPKARQLKMAILKSEILARANKITKEEDSSIDEELLSVIKDLDESVGYLKGTTATGTVGTSGYFTAPSDLIEGLIDSLLLGTDLDPLREITWAEYNEQVIDGYCYHNGRIYVRPTPDSDKSYTLDYRRYHAASLTTLEYPKASATPFSGASFRRFTRITNDGTMQSRRPKDTSITKTNLFQNTQSRQSLNNGLNTGSNELWQKHIR
jgi:hypothetical protein